MRIFFAAVLTAMTILAGTASAQSLLFLTDRDFAPYSMISQGKPAGIDVDVFREAAKRAGLAVDIQFKPWDELIRMVENGECDGAFSFFRTPEREESAIFADSVPIHYSDYVLFTRVSDTFSFKTYDDLSGKVIGTKRGINLGKEFADARDSGIMTMKEYDDLSAALKGLIMGEIDAYAGNIDVTNYRLKTMGMTSSIIYLPKKIVEQRPAYMVLSRASKMAEKELVIQKLEVALDRMRRDGTYNSLARHYLIRF